MRRPPRLTLTAIVVISLAVLSPKAAFAETATIGFEGLAEGWIVTGVSTPFGTVGVAGTPNPATVFDATCQPSCTGDDTDLFFPGQGNVLIVAENLVDANGDGLLDDPDDADVVGQTLQFTFPTPVTVERLWLADVGDDPGETGDAGESGHIELLGAGEFLDSVALPALGDHQATTVAVGVAGVTLMVVTLRGSGAIDDVVVSTIPPTETPVPPTDTPVPTETPVPPTETPTPTATPTLPVLGVTQTPAPPTETATIAPTDVPGATATATSTPTATATSTTEVVTQTPVATSTAIQGATTLPQTGTGNPARPDLWAALLAALSIAVAVACLGPGLRRRSRAVGR